LDDQYIQTETTETDGPNITEDLISISHVFGDQEGVNRSAETITLSLYIEDTNKSEPVSAITSYFNITQNGSEFTYSQQNSTSSGYANLSFSPDCSFNATKQHWKVFINDTCYVNATSSVYNVTVLGYYKSEVEYPLGGEYLRGTNITMSVNVTDEHCGALPSSDLPSTIAFNTTSDYTSIGYDCSPITDEGQGIYNCTFNTSVNPGVMSARGYSITVFSDSQYLNSRNTTTPYSGRSTGFWIDTVPLLEFPTLNTTDFDGDIGRNGSWSEDRNFTITVTDEDGDNVELSYWTRQWTGSSWGAWTKIDTQYPSDPDSELILFEEDGPTTYWNRPSHYGTWQFKFEAEDAE
ncbi:MAG: hypothetical protein KAT35_02860, partial [Candidatus Aenigmarchaeota archaeon]|nr:hypothetical protein [Candidatus Aenigmarchaeota archaeon]